MSNPNVVCPYCGKTAVFFENSACFYQGRDFGPLWACTPCYARVGVHKGTRTPLGNLANAETRMARRDAHQYFDHLWRRKIADASAKDEYLSKGRARGMAYRWLSKQMGMKPQECHIGMLNPEQCQVVVRLCKPYYNPAKLT